MKKLFILLTCFLFSIQVQVFCQTGNILGTYPVQNNTTAPLNVYQSADLNANVISTISPQKTAMVKEISFGNGAIWGKIDLPHETSAATGYIVLDCANGMSSVITFPSIEVKMDSTCKIYTSNTTASPLVMIGNNEAKIYAYQKVIVTQQTTGWCKIDLPNHCNQSFGWIKNPTTNSPVLLNAVSPGANMPTIPSLSTTSSTAASITLNGTASAGTTALKVINCVNSNFYTSGLSFPLTVTGLQGGTMYQFKVVATNSFGFSCASSCVTTATAGNVIPIANYTPSDLIVGVNQTIDFTNQSTNATIFSWNFGNTATSAVASPSYSYPSLGNYTVTLVAVSPTGHTNTTTKTISVVSNPPTGVIVDNLVFDATTITGGNIKTASGNVGLHLANCSTAVQFSGNITINKLTKRVSGDCRIYVPNVQGQDKDLYNGIFDLKVNNDSLDWTSFLNKKDSMQFELAGMQAVVRKMKVVCDGVEMKANVDLPSPITNQNGGIVTASLDTVLVKHNAGVKSSKIFIYKVMINHLYPIDSVNLSYNNSNDIFSGEFALLIPIDGPTVPQHITIENSRFNIVSIDCSSFVHDIPIEKLNLKITSMNYCNFKTAIIHTDFSFSANIEPIKPNELLALGQFSGKFRHTISNGLKGDVALSFCGNVVTNAHMEAHHFLREIEFYGPFQFNNFLDGNYHFCLERKKISTPFKKAKLSGLFDANVRMPNSNIINMIGNKTIRNYLNNHYTQGEYIAFTKNYVNNDYLCGLIRVPKKSNPDKTKFKFSYYYNLEGIRYFWFAPYCWAIPYGIRDVLSGNKTQSIISDGEYFFTLDRTVPNINIEAIGTNTMPQITLFTPTGDSITSLNIANYSDVISASNMNTKFIGYWYNNPPIGDYKIKIIGADSLNIFWGNAYPSVKLQTILQNTTAKTLNINWTDNDPDDDALISLFLDTDREGANGITFIDSLSENSSTDNYTFNYSNFATGDYYVGALIKDAQGQIGLHYFPTQFRLLGNNLPNAPTLNSVSATNNTVMAIMKRNNAQHLTYLLYYSPTTAPIKYYSNSIIIPDADTVRVDSLIPPGRSYFFAISAVDSLGRESAMSNTPSLNYVSTTVNNAPYFSTQNFKTTAKVATAYSYQLSATDADAGQTLTYSITPPITGLSVNNTGLMTWTPTANELGIHRVNVKVSDPLGAKDSVSFDIYVRDSSAYAPDISFDKNTFYTTNDGGIVTIIDDEFISNYNFLDSITVRLYSKSDLIGLTLKAKETSNKSREFVFDFKTGTNTLTSTRQLKVAVNDTIWVEYIRSGLTTRQIAYTSLFSALFKDTVLANTAVFANKSKGYNLIYSWNFGDGGIDSTRNPSHEYSSVGTYIITLTITDAEGRIANYTDTITISVLPVNWLDFQAKVADNGNLLTWKTGNEVNNDKFVVERSTDMVTFTDMGAVAAANSAQPTHDYEFTDTQPLLGKQYYRIRQIDIDGAFSHSNIIDLIRTENSVTLSLYPNPADKEVTLVVKTLKEIAAEWQLLTPTGVVVSKGQVTFNPSQNTVVLPLSDLAAGTYYLRLSIEGKTYHHSFVKQ